MPSERNGDITTFSVTTDKVGDICLSIYTHLRRSRDCSLIWLSVGLCVGVFIVSYALHLLILGSCYTAHTCIVNIMKVYIKRNNIQVELIRFRKNSDFVDV